MGGVYRPQYTRPVPEGAIRCMMAVKRRGGREEEVPAVRFKEDGRTVVAPLVTTGKGAGSRCRMRSPTWHGRVGGKVVPLTTNKAASLTMLAGLVATAAMGGAGLADRYKGHRAKPLAAHLDEWAVALAAQEVTGKHARQTAAAARRMAEGCGFKALADIEAVPVQLFLARLRADEPAPALPSGQQEFRRSELAAILGVGKQAVTDLIQRRRLAGSGEGKARRYPLATAEALVAGRGRGTGTKTLNHLLAAFKQFAGWLVEEGRMPSSPVERVKQGNASLNRRRNRRPLSADEARAVIVAASASKAAWRGLSGADRAVLYAVAFSTGFRAEELSLLTPRSFLLDAKPPVAVLLPEQTKNGKGARQPLPAEVAGLLAEHLRGKEASLPVWGGTWFLRAADMLRIDLDGAGIPYSVEGPSGQPVYADFHAARHTFIAMLDVAGATLRQAMQLARHSDPRLTMAIYGQAGLSELGGTVDRLPSLAGSACTLLAQPADGKGRNGMVGDGKASGKAAGAKRRNPLQEGELMGRDGS